MKLRIYLSKNTEPIPFNYPHSLCGIFHSLLGNNSLHDKLSLYSLGWLKGKTNLKNNALYFPYGAKWDIGIHDSGISEKLIRGLILNEFRCYGMHVRNVDRLQPPRFEKNQHRFLAGSPILLRKVEENGNRKHVIYSDPESNDILNRVIHNKAKEADMHKATELQLRFDTSYKNPKTKLIDIKGIKNRASVCPIVAEGPTEALKFLWEVGAGELTGVGFGSLDHTAA